MTYRKISYSQAFLHIFFGVAMLLLQKIGNNAEPLALALVYAMPMASLSPLLTALSYFAVSLFSKNTTVILLSALQASLLYFGFLVYRHALSKGHHANKCAWFALFSLTLALAVFVLFAPFTPYVLPFTFANELGAIGQKVVISALVFLLAGIFTVALKAMLGKFLKCRLKGDELVFSVLSLVLLGVGFCRFLGVNAYMGTAFFILLLFACVTKDATAIVCAFTLALPPALTVGLSMERFFVYGVVVSLFIKSGRLSATLALTAVFFLYGYADGLYTYPTAELVVAILSVTLPALFFMLLPAPFIRELENKLVFYREKHLSRIAINRNRATIGKQLYEISAVFREIQTTFSALGDSQSEKGAKEYIRNCIVEEACKNCAQYRACMRKGVNAELDKLIEIGCVKGRTSLIDIPKYLSEVCFNQSNLLYAVNRRIGEYKNYMTEAENSASGRTLLAGQAQGVSEILRNLALEQSEPLRMYTDKERAVCTALLSAGIVCSEILVYGEDPTLSLITFGKADVKKISAVASHVFQTPMMISERITLTNDKFCCILRKKPYFDAAFGVATATKTDEYASGDTHTVIKIDERRFLVALSDGMGSGEYARRVSESTITLLESFYRAKMPSDTVLSTVNKLLAFNREETFACVDIAVVDLEDGKTDIVKIGSPAGFILSGNTVKVLESTSLPLGILDCLRPDSSSYTLYENDVLLFLSDGITGAFGSTADLYEILKTTPTSNPQQLADFLLDSAIQAYGGVAKDDMTAVAVRLFKAVA
ncbi:MAG: hypothetical protein E7381_01955 [Clostridiales bacterium]|nr:hypothetical protein [Clostridiales bacterium]